MTQRDDGSPPPPAQDRRRISAVLKALLIAAGLALAVAGGYLASRVTTQTQAKVAGLTVLNDPRPVPAFRLQGKEGGFSNAQLLGRWTFFFFGYTHCPDVCPTALSLMKEVKAQLVAKGLAAPQVVFVSVDPKRDTPELLGQYVPAFDPAFIGVSGSDEALAPLIKHFGIYYQRHEQESEHNYTVDHSAGIYLVDPQGHLKALYMPPQMADAMASSFIALSSAPR